MSVCLCMLWHGWDKRWAVMGLLSCGVVGCQCATADGPACQCCSLPYALLEPVTAGHWRLICHWGHLAPAAEKHISRWLSLWTGSNRERRNKNEGRERLGGRTSLSQIQKRQNMVITFEVRVVFFYFFTNSYEWGCKSSYELVVR